MARHSTETKAKAVLMYKSGLSSTHVGRVLGVSNTNVARWVKQAGVKRDDRSVDRSGISVTTKRCGRCREIKLTESFGSNRSRHDGLAQYCLVCYRARGAAKRKPSGRIHDRWLTPNEEAAVVHRYLAGDTAIQAGAVIGRSETAARGVLGREGIETRDRSDYRQHAVDASYFRRIDDPIKAYWLGFLAADGYVSEARGYLRLVLQSGDRGHLAKFRECVRFSGPIKLIRHRRVVGVTVSCTEMAHDLASHGVVQAKSHILEPWEGPSELMADYWRGVFDGDGSASVMKSSSRARFSIVGTLAICDAFASFAEDRCGRRPSVHKHKSVFSAAGRGLHFTQDVLSTIYRNPPIYLDRKRVVVNKIFSLKRRRPTYKKFRVGP